MIKAKINVILGLSKITLSLNLKMVPDEVLGKEKQIRNIKVIALIK